jgi:hypothetical protein
MDIGRDLQMSNADPQTFLAFEAAGSVDPRRDLLEVLGQTKGDEEHGIPSSRIPDEGWPPSGATEWLSGLESETEWTSIKVSGCEDRREGFERIPSPPYGKETRF